MSLIICEECGKEFSDKASSCPNCGCPTKSQKNESKLIVYGLTQQCLGGTISLFLDDVLVGKVKPFEQFEIEITKDCVLTTKCTLSKKTINIKAGSITRIKMNWNRLSGAITPTIADGYNTIQSI